MEKTISKLKFHLITGTILSKIKFKLFSKKWRKHLNDIDYENKVNSVLLKYKFDLENPRTFNEHICWLKFHYYNELWCKCADKLQAKEFLANIGLGKNLPKTLGVYNSSKEINIKMLPNKFVLKTNHDSGSIFVCEKGKTNFNDVFKKLDKAISKKYSEKNKNHEWVYDNILPKIFAEEFLIDIDNHKCLRDFKFFCFNGKAKFFEVISNKDMDVKLDLYDIEKQQKINCTRLHLKSKLQFDFDENFFNLLDIVNYIAKFFIFVRIDVYNTNNGPKIGELTFFSSSGHGKFTPTKYDFEFGKYFDNIGIDWSKCRKF